jgi:hypothetical protein
MTILSSGLRLALGSDNCQYLGHVWANCKEPPRYLQSDGGHLHRKCPEKTPCTWSTPSCCNCTLVEGEKPRPASYWGCSHPKGELQRKEPNELQRDPLGGHSSISSPDQSSPTQLHCVKTRNTSNHRHQRHVGYACGPPCSSVCHNRKFREQVLQYRLPVRLTLTSYKSPL